jgi:hypothetical protein
VSEISSSETTHEVTVLVTNLTLLVDTHARHGVDTALLLFWLPALGLTDDVTVLVVDVAILVDLVASELLDIAFDDTSDDVALFGLNSAVLGNLVVVEASKRSLRTGVGTLGELGASDNVAFVVPDLALAIDLLADHGGWVALGNLSEDLAARVDDVASLVDSAASKSGEVDLSLLLLLVWLSVALDVAILVDDVAILVDRVANKLLLVAFGDLTNTVAIAILDESVLDDAQTLVACKRSLLLSDALIVGDKLATTDNLASVAVNLALAIRLAASEVLEVAFNETTDGNAVAVDKVTLLVQGKPIEHRQVIGCCLLLVLEGLSVTLHVAVLVKDVTIFIDLVTNEALCVAFDNFSDDVLIFVSDLAISNDAEAFKTSEGTLRLSLTLVLGDEFDTSDNLSGVVPELALAVEFPASKLLSVAFDKACDRHTLIADNVALLVDSLAFEAGEVDRVFLLRCRLLGLIVAFGMAND